ncbi:MAG: flagellar motor switch phosphatase FliY [Eubacteriales bacterium]|nr:flagellar motor switch phosphatase FliY [Eubacteriales bacterium]MDD3199259.1 flagellar motor switch phosphatase FliY [Eubacteriales bacterium]MDD4122286.1 flagellar motor switch phosphatase FliY [Eubacteriales bacterium]MDD4629389.1 flagellar motor switch phosphatase FliY [Eubacteriales bacterium]
MSNEDIVYKLTEMEADVIGEVMNISMGAAATAMSTILDKKVSITTPKIQTQPVSEFEFSNMEPVVGVLIKYIEGIAGTNILLLKEDDLKRILGHLLSMDPSEIAELDEIGMSAVCEIMNQMMGSASSALAAFFGKAINISPPEVLDTTGNLKELFSQDCDTLVNIEFNLSIDGLIESEFISVMELQLAKEIVKMSYGANYIAEEAEANLAVEERTGLAETVQTKPAETVQVKPAATRVNSAGEVKPEIAADAVTAAAPVSSQYVEQAPKERVYAAPYNLKPLIDGNAVDLGIDENNLELIMTVPIQITVELGKTKKKIRDIADLTVGNIVELNRLAGDQVDVVANGRLIAKGDVVVVDDYYSVRITEIVKAKDDIQEIK